MHWKSFLPALGLVLAAAAGAAGLDDSDLKVSAYSDAGRFHLSDTSVNGEVVSRTGARWLIRKSLNDNWTAQTDLHWLFWRNQATDRGLFHIVGLKFDADVQGMVAYASEGKRFRAGLYNFKYNPDSKNLGEYLLRSEAYPTYIENSQGKDLLAYSCSRVAGAEAGTEGEFWRQTAIVYAEQYNTPVYDLNAAYIAAAGPSRAQLGFGADYHRFLKFGIRPKATVLDSALRAYVRDQGLETTAFKFMLRGRLDLGAFLGWRDSCVLYGEAALLGLKNDSLYYQDYAQRMPVMAGADLPTFGLLDLLSLEVEYFRNPYFERKYPIADANGSKFSPLPYIDDYAASQLPAYHQDDWKWSLFLRKSLGRWVDIDLRIASDHLRLRNWDGDFEGGSPMTHRTWDPGSPWTLWTRDSYFLARIGFHN